MTSREQSKSAVPSAPIGVFDSGLGGLSILREAARFLPGEDFVYLADNLRMPYGPRPLAEVREYAVQAAGFLLGLGAKMVVLACNTASAAALKHLRLLHPDIPFVGMEPAVKPAAAASRTGKVGVLATQATFQGELFASVVERFAAGVEVIGQACPGLADFIEKRDHDSPEFAAMLAGWLEPLKRAGVDRLVLACTHYPLIADKIRRAAGPGIELIDPSPAIARRIGQVLDESDLRNPAGAGTTVYYATGDRAAFAAAAARAIGKAIAVEAARLAP